MMFRMTFSVLKSRTIVFYFAVVSVDEFWSFSRVVVIKAEAQMLRTRN